MKYIFSFLVAANALVFVANFSLKRAAFQEESARLQNMASPAELDMRVVVERLASFDEAFHTSSVVKPDELIAPHKHINEDQVVRQSVRQSLLWIDESMHLSPKEREELRSLLEQRYFRIRNLTAADGEELARQVNEIRKNTLIEIKSGLGTEIAEQFQNLEKTRPYRLLAKQFQSRLTAYGIPLSNEQVDELASLGSQNASDVAEYEVGSTKASALAASLGIHIATFDEIKMKAAAAFLSAEQIELIRSSQHLSSEQVLESKGS